MAFHYNESRSEIMEQLFIPIYAADKSVWEWDFTKKEEVALDDALDIISELQKLFIPYREQIDRYYLMGGGENILTSCFVYGLNQGKDFKTVEDLYDYMLQLSADEVDFCLRFIIVSGSVADKKESDWMTLLEETSHKPDFKWQFLSYVQNPLENIKKTVALSRELVKLYQPYLDKGRAERQAYARDVDIETILEKSANLNLDEVTIWGEDVEYYIFSPWLIRFMFLSDQDNYRQYRHFLMVSCRIDKLLLSHNEFDDDNFSAALKTLSDLSRYRVLVELTRQNVKSKDIAESLGITSAAVSFHRQKLVNAQLLLVNIDDKSAKYDANKELIENIIYKLKEDFNIE